jgi:hypothetical protein
MNNDRIHVIDNFIDKTRLVHFDSAVAQSDFRGVDFDGKFYPGVAPVSESATSCAKLAMLENGVANRISNIEVMADFIRLETKDTPVTAWIHHDRNCGGDYTLIGYISEPPAGEAMNGTAFWRHHISGDTNEAMADSVESRFLHADSHDQSKWQLTGFVGAKKNRALIFPSNRFHSRYPYNAYGTTKEDGRLIYVCFFSLK